MSERTPSSEKKRRYSPRRLPRVRVMATCRRSAPGVDADLTATLLDVSETGVRLIVAEALKVGSEVSVGLQGPGNTRPVVRTGKVAWSLPTTAGACCVGIGFQKRLAHRELLDFTRDLPAFG